jgi:hypothetical protein
MNIRRGLFRVWVVLSLIWVCLIGVIFFANAQQYFKPIRLTVAGSNFEFPGTTSRSAVKAVLVSFFEREKINGSRMVTPQMDPELDAAEISQKFSSQDFPEFALQVSVLVLAIPAIVFALGALLLWIGAGFRQPSGRSPG